MKLVPTARSLVELHAILGQWRQNGEKIGLIPTMGALHEGHLALIRQARAKGQRPVVSIFINPTQFGPNEDFAAYPRREAEDLAKLTAEDVGLAWLPHSDEMYPPRFSTTVSVGGLTDDLEGEIRPDHFIGVATVVAKLLLQVLPDSAYFGEKDYQQLQVVKRLASDLNIPVKIEGVPTVRDFDGLALSSRNAYLSAEDRQRASSLPRILNVLVAEIETTGFIEQGVLDQASAALLDAGFQSVDYLTIRDAETLMPVTGLDRPSRILVAARLGLTRLLDNFPVKAQR